MLLSPRPVRIRGFVQNALFLRGVVFDIEGAGTAGTPATNPATPPAAPPANPATPALTAQQVQQQYGPLLTEVRSLVTAAVAPIQQQITQTQTDLQQLRGPQRQVQSLFGGGAPGVRTGEDPLTSRGYSMTRVVGLRQGFLRADEAKVEVDVHNRLYDLFVKQGGMICEGQNSILAPLSSGSIWGADNAMGTEIRQMLRAGVMDADPMEAMHLLRQHFNMTQTQALSYMDDTGLGVMLGPTQMGEMIDLLRAKEVFSRAGATELPLPPNGRLTFPKHTQAVTAYWVGEVPSNASTPTITASEPKTGYITLLAKKLATLVKLPNELLRYATPTLEAFVRNDMATTMALKADGSMLDAIGSTLSIRGLINYSGVVPYTAGTVATDGNTFEPEDVAMMIAELEEREHDVEMNSPAWVMRPKMWSNLTNRRAAAHTAGTYDGPWLFPTNRGDIAKGAPPMLQNYRVVKSTQVSNARSKGSGTDLSYILFGLFRHWLIGRVGVMEFATTTQGDTPFQTDQTWIRAIQHIDAGPRYENAFCVCDNLDMDLP